MNIVSFHIRDNRAVKQQRRREAQSNYDWAKKQQWPHNVIAVCFNGKLGCACRAGPEYNNQVALLTSLLFRPVLLLGRSRQIVKVLLCEFLKASFFP